MGEAKFTFEWKLHQFRCDRYPFGKAIDSPIFKVENFGGSEWCIRLYPSGEEKYNTFPVYLCKKKNDIYSKCSCISFECEMLDDFNRSLCKAKIKEKGCLVNERIGWENFLYSETVLDELKDKYIRVLTVRCHIFDTREHSHVVNQISFSWDIKISDILSKPVLKDNILKYHKLALSMSDDILKINLSGKIYCFEPYLVECKLSLVKPEGNVLKSESSIHLFDGKCEWNFPDFITKTDLDNHSGCWKNDYFSLFCEIASSEITPTVSSSKPNTVLKDLKNMLHNHIHSDTKLKVGDEELPVHRSILAARSPVFSAMFDQDMFESQTGVIDVPDFEADTVKLFLEFLYTDSIEYFSYKRAVKLFVIADKYQVKTLVEKCSAFLEHVLAVENAFDILLLCDAIAHEGLKKATLDFFAINSKILFITSEWKELMKENVKLAGEITSNIALNFKIVPK